MKQVLDACCGSRMFWFDKNDERAVFVDIRRERHELPDASSRGGQRELVIDPDYQADFTALPFPDGTFHLVVFDPPHFQRNGAKSWIGLGPVSLQPAEFAKFAILICLAAFLCRRPAYNR